MTSIEGSGRDKSWKAGVGEERWVVLLLRRGSDEGEWLLSSCMTWADTLVGEVLDTACRGGLFRELEEAYCPVSLFCWSLGEKLLFSRLNSWIDCLAFRIILSAFSMV